MGRLIAFLLGILVLGVAHPQVSFPSKPVRLIVGFPPGGGNDLMARLLGGKLQEAWGQPVLIENRAGANAIIATEYVAKSAADGCRCSR